MSGLAQNLRMKKIGKKMNDILGSILTKQDITVQFVDDIMCCALEGGIDYWCISAYPVNMQFPEGAKYTSDCLSRGRDIILEEFDDYDQSVTFHTLTLQKFISGLSGYFDDFGGSISELHDNHDAGDADIIVQYSIFGKVVYA